MPLSNLFISHCRTPTSPLLCPQDNGNTRSLSSPFSSMTGFLPDTQNFARSHFPGRIGGHSASNQLAVDDPPSLPVLELHGPQPMAGTHPSMSASAPGVSASR